MSDEVPSSGLSLQETNACGLPPASVRIAPHVVLPAPLMLSAWVGHQGGTWAFLLSPHAAVWAAALPAAPHLTTHGLGQPASLAMLSLFAAALVLCKDDSY